MKKIFFCLLVFVFSVFQSMAQSKKFDTTVKMGDQGFRVDCNNKNPDKNEVTVSPIGLQVTGSKPAFSVYGKVRKAFTDDMNDDGRPDLVICIYSGDSGEIGSVAAISYNADKAFDPVYFPDIYLDSKIREGYKGHDEFSALTGTLMRRFPIYLPADAPGRPTGGTRVVQYKIMTDNGRQSFKVLRSYDTK
ncbi:hypothetical protein [Parafilimonas sp.]|uniref:hypothetical protein n=1 Tax=Parafilimonas sp. TaxID=1969739 RepID=UPI0039E59A7D